MKSTVEQRGYRFGPERRVRKKREYDEILGANRSRSDGRLIVFLAERSIAGEAETERVTPPSRLGLIVGRKVGHAPRRNRVKRLVREAFRLLQHELPAGLDIVVMPRPEAAKDLTLTEVQESLKRLVQRPLPAPRARKKKYGRNKSSKNRS